MDDWRDRRYRVVRSRRFRSLMALDDSDHDALVVDDGPRRGEYLLMVHGTLKEVVEEAWVSVQWEEPE